MAGSHVLRRISSRIAEVMIATAIAVIGIVGLSAHSGAFTLVTDEDALILAVHQASSGPGQVVAVRDDAGYRLTSASSGPALVAVRSLPHAGWALSFVQGWLVRFVLAACMPLTLLVIVGRAMSRPRRVGERRPTSVASCPATSSSSSPQAVINLSEQRKASPSLQLPAQRELMSACG